MFNKLLRRLFHVERIVYLVKYNGAEGAIEVQVAACSSIVLGATILYEVIYHTAKAMRIPEADLMANVDKAREVAIGAKR